MSWRSWWHQRRARTARQYLAQYPDLALDLLRQDTALGSQVMAAFLETEAAQAGPDRRSYPYPTWGMGGTRPLQHTHPKPLSWQVRQFALCPPARRAINCLSNPLLDLRWSVGLKKPIGSQEHDELPPPTSEQQARIEAAVAMLQMPNDSQTWREFLEMLLEDLIVLGACPIEIQANRSDPRPLFLWPVDAASIRINTAWEPGSAGMRYSQGRGGVFGAIGTTEDIQFTDAQLVYPRLNPRTDTPFGTGYLEVALSTVNSFLGAFDFATRRASNASPLFGLFLGENMTLDQVRQWQHYWEVEIEGRGKTPILGGGRAPEVFSMVGDGADPLYLAWQEWLLRVIAIAFGLSPMKLGIERDVNRSTAETQGADDWETIAPLAGVLQSVISYELLDKRLGWDDLEFTWHLKEGSAEQQAALLLDEYTMNAITVDELRKLYGRPPLPDGLGNLTKTAYEAAVKVALAPPPPVPGFGPEGLPGDTGPGATRQQPGGEEGTTLQADEVAFLRELMRRRHRNGTAAGRVSGKY